MGAVSAVSIAILVAVAAAPARASDAIPWTDDVRGAFRVAKRELRPIVVDVWAVWCAPCKVMDESTYVSPAVVEGMVGTVPLKVDADANEVFVERYRAGEALPTTLFLDGDGREIGRLVGAVGPTRMSEVLATLTSGYADYLVRRDAWNDVDALRSTARFVRALGNGGGSIERLRRARKLARKDGRPDLERDLIDLEYATALLAGGESKEAGEELAALVERTADPAVRGRALVILADAERTRGRLREADVVLERLHREFPDLADGVGSAP